MTAAGPPMRSERETMPGIDRASAVLAPLYEQDGRAARGAHAAHVGDAGALGRGELPRRAPGRGRGPVGHRAARGPRGDPPRRRRHRTPRRARPPRHHHEPLLHRPLRRRPPWPSRHGGEPRGGVRGAPRPDRRAPRPGDLPRGAVDVPVGRGPPDLLLRAGRRHGVGRHRSHAPPAARPGHRHLSRGDLDHSDGAPLRGAPLRRSALSVVLLRLAAAQRDVLSDRLRP